MDINDQRDYAEEAANQALMESEQEDDVYEADGVEVERPDDETLGEWIYDGVAEALDGCQVEPDGTCPHGHVSWLIALGII